MKGVDPRLQKLSQTQSTFLTFKTKTSKRPKKITNKGGKNRNSLSASGSLPSLSRRFAANKSLAKTQAKSQEIKRNKYEPFFPDKAAQRKAREAREQQDFQKRELMFLNTNLKETNKELTRDNHRLRMELERFNNRTSAQEERAHSLRMRLHHHAQVENLEADIMYAIGCADELHDLRKEHSVALHELADATETRNRMQHEISSLHSHLFDEKEHRRKDTVELDAMIIKFSQVETEHLACVENRMNSRADAERIHASVTEMKRELAEAQRAAHGLKATVESMERQCAEVRAGNSSLTTQVVNCSATINEINGELENYIIKDANYEADTHSIRAALVEAEKFGEEQHKIVLNHSEYIERMQAHLSSLLANDKQREEAKVEAQELLRKQARVKLGFHVAWHSRRTLDTDASKVMDNAEAIQRSFELFDNEQALLISEVSKGINAASEAGLRVGDIITTINKRPAHIEVWLDVKTHLVPGDLLVLEIMRPKKDKDNLVERMVVLQSRSHSPEISSHGAQLLKRVALFNAAEFTLDFKHITQGGNGKPKEKESV